MTHARTHTTIAVTGATGFLGRALVDALRARGARVVGVVRNPARVPALASREGVELRRADLGDVDALAAGFAGCDALIANAALFDVRNRDWDAHVAANIRGTENVLSACARAGIRRVVHVSSVAVYAGRARPGAGAIDEDHPQWTAATRRSSFNAYPVSKALSEQRAWELARAHSLALTAVRPSAIYGPFDPNFTRIFRKALSLPVGLLPLKTDLPLVYVRDVAEACATALERDETAGRAYNTAGDARTLRDFIEAWVAAGGPCPRWLVPLPVPLRLRYDNGRAERDLAFTNRPFARALAETLALDP